jgi:hypothetical protein
MASKSTPLGSDDSSPQNAHNERGVPEMISIQETLDSFTEDAHRAQPQQHPAMYTDISTQPDTPPDHPPQHYPPVHAMHVFPMYPVVENFAMPAGTSIPSVTSIPSQQFAAQANTVRRPNNKSTWDLVLHNLSGVQEVRFALFIGLLCIVLQLVPDDLCLSGILPAYITHHDKFGYLARGAFVALTIVIMKNWGTPLPIHDTSGSIIPDEADIIFT